MWWRNGTGGSFAESPVCHNIDSCFRAFAGIETRAFLAALGLSSFPGDLGAGATLCLSPPSSPPFVLSFDPEKGIRLHFAPDSTSPDQRDAVWQHLASFAAQFRQTLEASLLFRLRARFRRPGPLEWWLGVVQVVSALESSDDPPQSIGALLVGEPGA
jgi:hypothetical protein